MGAQDKRNVRETHLGSGSGREGREAMVMVEEREDGGAKRASGRSYIARPTIQTPPGKRHWHHWTAKHTEAQQARNCAQMEQKEALSDGIACESRHPELCPNTDFVRIRKQMLGPTKGCGAHSREQKQDYHVNERSVSHKFYITLRAFCSVILCQRQKEGAQRVAIARRRKLSVL